MTSDSRPAPAHPPSSFQEARVVEVVRETPSTVTVRFSTATPMPYRPGQYVNTEFRLGPGRYRRAYSLSSVPADPYPAFTVKQVPGGKVSEHCNHRLAAGDRFRVSLPEGNFVLPDSRAGRRFVLVAGGSGITPVLSLLRTLLAMPQPPAVTLLYYSHASNDIIFREPLQRLATAHPAFDLQMHVTGPREAWEGPVEPFAPRHLQAALGNDPAQVMAYLCGPESLIEAARNGLLEAGVVPAAILVEHFTASPVRERPAEGHAITFLGRGPFLLPRRVRVRGRAGESLLDAAERAGLKVRSRCRNGSCGSCRATLLRGEVLMDEPNALSPADVRANRVLTCIAWPATPVIVDLRH